MPISEHNLSLAVWGTDPVAVAYTGTAGRSTQLPKGVYYLNATSACHFKQGGSTVAATTSSSYLPEGAVVAIEVANGTTDAYVSVIEHSADGTAYLNRPTPGI